MRRRRFTTDAEFEHDLASLETLSRGEIVERWKVLFREAPPKGLSTTFLLRAVTHEMQARRFGALAAPLRRRLLKIAEAAPDTTDVQAGQLKLGTRLLREWNGTAHIVEVTDGGYVWNGKTYRSLSAIARTITGARWSGPRFFGLGSTS